MAVERSGISVSSAVMSSGTGVAFSAGRGFHPTGI
jgi:hypothetical protein